MLFKFKNYCFYQQEAVAVAVGFAATAPALGWTTCWYLQLVFPHRAFIRDTMIE